MAAPTSAKPLPLQTPNSSAPLVTVDIQALLRIIQAKDPAIADTSSFTDGSVAVEASVASLSGYVTNAWRYIFNQFALTSPNINPNFSQSISASPTQAEVQELSNQVALLSQQIGRMS